MSDLPVAQRPIEWYARLVRETWQRRKIQERAYDLARACNNGHTPEDLFEETAALWRLGRGLTDPDTDQGASPTEKILDELRAELAVPRHRRLILGFPPIDIATRGILAGEVFTIVARPRVGKSAIASQIGLNVAIGGGNVIFFSLEMPRSQCLVRILQQCTGLTEEMAEREVLSNLKNTRGLALANFEAAKEKIAIIDRRARTLEGLAAGLEEASQLLGGAPRLVIIDHAGLLRIGSRSKSAYERVSEAAVEIKNFAKEHEVTVLLLCQAHRSEDPEKREGAAPLGLGDARDSGQIEENADFMLTMWRPELSKKMKDIDRFHVQNQIHLSMVKNRRGPEPNFYLRFDKPTLQITDPDCPQEQGRPYSG